MAFSSGYWIELAGLRFEEGTNTTWIQAMPLGKYNHPVHGEIAITPERVSQFADNVNNKVRSQQLDIDYDHKAKTGEAAGWVNKAEARNDGLWILVEWTKKAAEAIKEKAYRYFSPEFVDEWTHPKDGKTHKDVLFGGGITNRPFLKDILPMNMEEVFANTSKQPTSKEGKLMNPQLKKLAEQLGVSEGADDDQTFAGITAKLTEVLAAETSPKEPVKAAEVDPLADVKKLAEDNPAIKALIETVNAQEKKLGEVAVQLREASTQATIKALTDKAAEASFIIPPASLESLTKMLNESSPEQSSVAIKAFEEIIGAKVVMAGEKGHQSTLHVVADAETALDVAVKKFMETNKGATYGEAVASVTSTNPDLASNYLNEVTGLGGN